MRLVNDIAVIAPPVAVEPALFAHKLRLRDYLMGLLLVVLLMVGLVTAGLLTVSLLMIGLVRVRPLYVSSAF